MGGEIHFPADDGAVVALYGGGAWEAEALRRLEETLGEGAAGAGEALRAVAGAAAGFLREEGLERKPLPDAYVDQLLWRGLLAAGLAEEARRWERARLPAKNGLRAFDPAVWPGPVPLAAWELFESGAVRPERAPAMEGRMAWILDFRRMAPGGEGWLELTLFPGLRRLLEWLAPAWDARGGRGVLGLRGLAAAGFPKAEAAAVRRHCEAVLARVAASRGWTRAPETAVLDFAEAAAVQETAAGRKGLRGAGRGGRMGGNT